MCALLREEDKWISYIGNPCEIIIIIIIITIIVVVVLSVYGSLNVSRLLVRLSQEARRKY